MEEKNARLVLYMNVIPNTSYEHNPISTSRKSTRLFVRKRSLVWTSLCIFFIKGKHSYRSLNKCQYLNTSEHIIYTTLNLIEICNKTRFRMSFQLRINHRYSNLLSRAREYLNSVVFTQQLTFGTFFAKYFVGNIPYWELRE